MKHADMVRLERPSSSEVPADKTRTANKATPELHIPELPVPEIAVPELTTPELPVPELGIPELGIPELGIPLRGLIGLNVIASRAHIIECRDVQTGHSQGEQLIYSALWNAAQPIQGGGLNRVITAGYRVIGTLCKSGMTINNVKANVLGLIRKRAVARIGEGTPIQGSTYIVFPYVTILENRRAAGLTHVIRRTRKVEFVDPNSGIPVLGIPELSSGIPKLGTVNPNSGIPKLGAPYKKEIRREEEERREEARRILDDPNSTPNEQTAAKAVLGEAD